MTKYDRYYFQHSCGKPYERTEEWLRFFAGIAETIVRKIEPQTVLDAGCAMGFLVEGLRERGVQAFGVDISEFALSQVRADLQPYCQRASVLEPLSQRYDLIVSIEVLEHLNAPNCERAVKNLCDASDDILFSSTPTDYREATHFNVQPPEYWAGLFAMQGFVRDVDFDASFITPWAMRFRRSREPLHRIVQNYERHVWQLRQERQELRSLALEMRDQLAGKQQVAPVPDQRVSELATRVERAQPNADAHVLVISHEIVGERMAGPGIRYYNLARVLAREFSVVLAVPEKSGLTAYPDFSVLPYHTGKDAALEESICAARAVLIPAVVFTAMPSLQQTSAALIIDGYDPFVSETLFMQGDVRAQQAALTEAYLAGDFFICASERQRDWWLGLLEANGRINAQTYAEDRSLRRLVDLVPFGLSETSPTHTRQTIKGIWQGIEVTDCVILWGGGLWQWLDPLTAIHAMAQVWRTRKDVRLIFPGTQHPNPAMANIPMHAESAHELAQQLGLLGRAVFFSDWVSYADWENVLLESDLAITLHHAETIETRLAFRSRVSDYIWAGLPIIATHGDATSEFIAARELGCVVNSQDVDGVANAILHLLETPRTAFAERFETARQELTWERAARPLIEFCRHPRRAPDKVALAHSLGNPFYLNTIQRLQDENELAQRDRAQMQNLVSAYERRRVVRLINFVQTQFRYFGGIK